jgi:hypothetical protein
VRACDAVIHFFSLACIVDLSAVTFFCSASTFFFSSRSHTTVVAFLFGHLCQTMAGYDRAITIDIFVNSYAFRYRSRYERCLLIICMTRRHQHILGSTEARALALACARSVLAAVVARV